MTTTLISLHELRCPQCLGPLSSDLSRHDSPGAGILRCVPCNEDFPVIDSVPRMLNRPLREALLGGIHKSKVDQKIATARSFGFEWSRFSEMHPEWKQNFLGYMAPHGSDFFHGKRVLDAGCGTGRHAFYAAECGASVWAMDLGPAIEIARRNTSRSTAIQCVQADLCHPPFELQSFDFIYSIGVLHHLPDPEGAFRNLIRFLKPAGEIQIYLYWKPEQQSMKRFMLALVKVLREMTIRVPHRVLYFLSYPAAWFAYLFFVWPYQLLRHIRVFRSLAEHIPMKQYADYPFRVCVNDQFDRFSAPIENRYTREEVKGWLEHSGLEDIEILPFFGWVATGRKRRAEPSGCEVR